MFYILVRQDVEKARPRFRGRLQWNFLVGGTSFLLVMHSLDIKDYKQLIDWFFLVVDEQCTIFRCFIASPQKYVIQEIKTIDLITSSNQLYMAEMWIRLLGLIRVSYMCLMF